MRPTRMLLVAFAGLTTLTIGGTVGYVLIEGLPWLDALFMTAITISTVGYGEVAPLSHAGRIFTIGLIITGVGVGLYLLSSMAELLIEGRIRYLMERRAMQKQIDKLEGHVIVCGYGRFGAVVVEELSPDQLACVIIESDPSREPELVREKVPYVIGSALSDEVLEQAGVRRASSIVIATSSDSDNVFITLSARELNPRIRVHARAESATVKRRLRLAGAENVISAYQMGGMRMAAALLRPSVVDFLEISTPWHGEPVDLEEIRVGIGSPLSGKSIEALEREAPRLRIVALKRPADPIRVIPDADMQVEGDDHLVVIGERPSLEKLSQQAQGTA